MAGIDRIREASAAPEMGPPRAHTDLIAYFEGEYVPLRDANVNVMTHAFMYGTATFEGIRGYWNQEHGTLYLLFLREHIDRIRNNAKMLLVENLPSAEELSGIILETVRRNGFQEDIYVRPSFYKSTKAIGVRLHHLDHELYVITTPFGNYIDVENGVRVMSSTWRRNADEALPARGKIVGGYVNMAFQKSEAELNGFDEALVLDPNGHVSGGSAANLFMVRDGVLITPPVSDDTFEGVTRKAILTLAEDAGIPNEVRSIDRSELYVCDEVFLCGTGVQVSPVIEVDHRPVGTGKVGPIARRISEAYFRAVRGNDPNYLHWLTPSREARRPYDLGRAVGDARSDADAPGLPLDDFVSRQVDARPGVSLAQVGRASSALLGQVGDKGSTATWVAHSYWQAYLESRAYRLDLGQLGMTPEDVSRRHVMVVPHDLTQFSLLILSEKVGRPEALITRPHHADLVHGWDSAVERRARVGGPAARWAHRLHDEFDLSSDLAVEAAAVGNFYLVVAPAVEEELTTAISPAVRVAVEAGKHQSTAGARVRDSLGRSGVTAAAHAVPPSALVTVDGRPGTIEHYDDRHTDSCFIAVGEVSDLPVRATFGPLRLAPRPNESVFFEGSTSGLTRTRVTAHNPELPYIDPNLQQTVRTEWVTAGGDSGAALIDSGDYIIGFCYDRSKASAPFSYSTWIWAAAVFDRHGLEIV